MPVAPWPEATEESEAKRPRVSGDSTRNRECRRSIQSAGGICWSSADLALAATLLDTPNARFPTVAFNDLEEKRRVFTLVYDVLRYKSILNQALNDLYFFIRYPHLKERCYLVWLLFFDLYKRDFTVRDPMTPAVEEAFSQQGLHEIDELLWQMRVKLAATVSRLRIKSGAHSLSQLLPRHLQHTRSALEENIITGWVNIFKTNMKEAIDHLVDLGVTPLSRARDDLLPSTFKTDHLLPRFLHLMPNNRELVVDSRLVLDHHIIMQERTFCLGPAVMAQLLKDYALSGKVAQTHVNSPVTMAYFANLLINNDKIEALLVFGAGYRKEACEQYLQELGVKNTRVFSESFAGLSPENKVLDNVIAVLATPPNTNSSVVDPVDLAVARGGDLQILQQLTDDDFASTPRGENINKFLREQRDTLRRAMSKPQIQFVVYETHSRFNCENEEMSTALVNELNNYAAEVHLEELRRVQGETQEWERERVQAESNDTQMEGSVTKPEEEISIPIQVPVQSIVIPPSDLFEISDLPDLCPNFENCLDLVMEGTYVAVIKRKEIIRLDPKYMIQMAEARGLFGRPDATPKVKTSGQTARAKAALAALQARSEAMQDKSKSKVKVEVDRIAAPTRASLLRDIKPPSAKDCPRFQHHLAHDGRPSFGPPFPHHKDILTRDEEEELIRRLYTCPRINIFPARLYEDLPPLEFWNSPAVVIENYLHHQVFQRRLQMAYEFNQNKETEMQTNNSATLKAPEQLTQAMLQLTENMSYYQLYSENQIYDDLQKELAAGQIHTPNKKQNQDVWDQICSEDIPSEEEILSHKSTPIKEKTYVKLLKEIKKRYFNYQDFYRLKNLNHEKEEPLALTIGMERGESWNGQLISSEENNCVADEVKHKDNNSNKQKSIDFSKAISEKLKAQHLEESSVSTEKFQKTPSLELFQMDLKERHQRLHEEIVEANLLSILSQSSSGESILHQGNTTLRDSVTLTKERLPGKYGIIPLPKKNKREISVASFLSHQDSYTMLTRKRTHEPKTKGSLNTQMLSGANTTMRSRPPFDRQSLTLSDPRDSIILHKERLSTKIRSKEGTVCTCCDNNRYSRIRFTCSFHSDSFSMNYTKSTLGSNATLFSGHRDSVDIARIRLLNKEEDTRQSTACQTEDVKTHIANFSTEKTEPLQATLGIKGSQKCTRSEVSAKQEDFKLTPSKLSNYLMKSVQINQIILDKDSKPIN